jgi:hypothetical protein
MLNLVIDFEECEIDMLSDVDTLRVFPFDSVRFDQIFCPSGDTRLETNDDVKVEIGVLDTDGERVAGKWILIVMDGEEDLYDS